MDQPSLQMIDDDFMNMLGTAVIFFGKFKLLQRENNLFGSFSTTR